MDTLSVISWFEITPTSLTITGRPTFEQWSEGLRDLQKIRACLPFLIGDMLVQGESLFGESYAQAVEATGYTAQTLMNYASVCRRIPKERRSESLTFSHHALVAAEPAESQANWLDVAEGAALNTSELREAIMLTKRIREEVEVEYVVDVVDVVSCHSITVTFTEAELEALGSFLGGFTGWSELEAAAVHKLEEAWLAL